MAEKRNSSPDLDDLNDNAGVELSSLNEQAQRCRRLAEAMYDREVSDMLGTMADGYERTAAQLAKKHRPADGNLSE